MPAVALKILLFSTAALVGDTASQLTSIDLLGLHRYAEVPLMTQVHGALSGSARRGAWFDATYASGSDRLVGGRWRCAHWTVSAITRRQTDPRSSMLSTMRKVAAEAGWRRSGDLNDGVRAGDLTQAGPVLREQFVQAVLGQVRDLGQDIGQPGERIDVVQHTGGDLAELYQRNATRLISDDKEVADLSLQNFQQLKLRRAIRPGAATAGDGRRHAPVI